MMYTCGFAYTGIERANCKFSFMSIMPHSANYPMAYWAPLHPIYMYNTAFFTLYTVAYKEEVELCKCIHFIALYPVLGKASSHGIQTILHIHTAPFTIPTYSYTPDT